MYQSPHLYRRNAPPGTPEEIVDRVLQLEQRQRKYNVHPIYTLGHLAALTEVKYTYLESIVDRRHDPYSVFEISKSDGRSKRSIAAPEVSIAGVQRWLSSNVFGRMEVDDHAYAYLPRRSAAQSAREHLGADWMLKFDLRDFFHEIDERRIYRILKAHEYSQLVSFQIARLVTRFAVPPQEWLPDRYAVPSNPYRHGLPHQFMHFLGYLPQGSPASGSISNVVARPLDIDMAALASDNQLTYTRYADDFVLSGTGQLDRSLASSMISTVRRVAKQNGFQLNEAKTKVLPAGRELSLLGIRVTGGEMRVSRSMRARIESLFWGIERFGLANHAAHKRFHDPESMLHFLKGSIDYVNDVEPALASTYYHRFRSILARQNGPQTPGGPEAG